MAAEIITPTDVLTGLPHPILPYDVTPRYGRNFEDFHHHNFPRRSPELLPALNLDPHAQPEDYGLSDIASIALKVCRGQLLLRTVHESGHKKLLGPELPTTIKDKYIHVAKACAGIVSRWAIDLRRADDDLLVYMDDDTFAKVANPKVLCGERYYFDRPANFRRRIIGSFLLQYSLEQDLSHISSQVVDQFLSTDDAARRMELGNLLLRDALEISLASVLPLHRQLKMQGMVQPGKADARASIKKYIHPERLPSYHQSLYQKLMLVA